MEIPEVPILAARQKRGAALVTTCDSASLRDWSRQGCPCCRVLGRSGAPEKITIEMFSIAMPVPHRPVSLLQIHFSAGLQKLCRFPLLQPPSAVPTTFR